MCTGMEIAVIGGLAAGNLINAAGQSAISNYQADVARIRAEAQEQAGELRADRIRERAMRVAASARSALGASGVKIDSPTGQMIESDIVSRGVRDEATAIVEAKDRATSLRMQADIYEAEAQQAPISALINTGASAISLGTGAGWFG